MYEDRANTRANINVKIRTRKKGGFSTHLTSPRLISSLGTGTRCWCSIPLHASKYRLYIHIYISNSERSASIYRLTTRPLSQNNRLHVESKHDTEIQIQIQIRTTTQHWQHHTPPKRTDPKLKKKKKKEKETRKLYTCICIHMCTQK